ncbi:MAG: DUF3516 domain-containing protein [Sandaracinaceae bacterium]|nr:DUF3516 domain-containing protein [Sandaracinaceae bacterium]
MSLAAHLPNDADPDALLEGLLAWVSERGLELYPAQEEAILELFAGRSVILNTPTGSGKSLVATALAFKALAEGKRVFYTAPIKALVSEKFFAACRDFGPERVGMMTGDASVNRDAPLICCTAEILANVALREGASAGVDCVVMDEFHYYADRDRGWAWQVPLLTLSKAQFLLMSATLGDVRRFEEAIQALTGEVPAVIKRDERPVPLAPAYSDKPIQEAILDLSREGRAPIYVVHFTQRAAVEAAQSLMSVDFLSKERKQRIKDALGHFRFDSPFGKDLGRFVRHGIGVHHAGLLPRYRLLVEKLAQEGLLEIICGTDTLGVGVNVPIRTVLFTQLCKFDGKKTSLLSVRDFKQIAGRAGRKGFDDAGFVVCQAPEHVIENVQMRSKAGDDPKKLRKLHFKKPPEKGYAHWDEQTFERLWTSEPETLESRFDVTHGTILQVLDREDGRGCPRLKALVKSSHETRKSQLAIGRKSIAMIRSLCAAGVLEIEDRKIWVNADLQEDFSLHHALSLYVVESIGKLDRESPTYALDVFTLVEATLEDPMAILIKQLDKRKGDAIAQMKAEGLEYDERMAKLDEIDIAKPNLEWLLETYEAFRAKHPWVGREALAPKSIAREMMEGSYGFFMYVKEYGLARAEGILLRYLSEAYKALVQNVPESAKTDELYDLTDELGAIVREVDSSLIDEWERLKDPVKIRAEVEQAPAVIDVTTDRRGFVAMVRSVLHQLVRAFALGRFDEAVELVEPGWSAEALARAVAPYFEEHAELRFDPGARVPRFTLIEEGEGEWIARQVLVDHEEHNDWSIEARVDLARSREESRAVLELRAIGPTSS